MRLLKPPMPTSESSVNWFLLSLLAAPVPALLVVLVLRLCC